MTREEYEGQRRRLQADAELARRGLVEARGRYEDICAELADLRYAWQDQEREQA